MARHISHADVVLARQLITALGEGRTTKQALKVIDGLMKLLWELAASVDFHLDEVEFGNEPSEAYMKRMTRAASRALRPPRPKKQKVQS